MFKNLLNFQGINWWTLLGGLGLNFVIVTGISIGGLYLSVNEATANFYQNYGPILVILLIFLACGLAGYVVARIADDEPLKHAFWSSMGAAVPLLLGAVLAMCQNPMQFMLVLVAVAGALNGGMLATPRPRYRPPQDRDRPPQNRG